MKRLIPIAFLFLLLAACQPAGPKNVLLTSGPEVDNVAKNVQNYVSGNWDAFRAAYADTAQAFHNNGMMTPDSLVAFHKMARNNYDKVEFVTYATEYLKFENGMEYTHLWGLWKATVKGTGKAIEMNIHIASQLANGKIGREWAYYDTAPVVAALTEARQAAEAAAAAAAVPAKGKK